RCVDLLLERHAVRVQDVDATRRLIGVAQVGVSNVEAATLVIVPDGIRSTRNRYPPLFSTAGEIERDNCASIARHKCPAALLIEAQAIRPGAAAVEPRNYPPR